MPEFLTLFLVRTAKADGGKALEIRDSRVSGLILRVEPTGSKRYLALLRQGIRSAGWHAEAEAPPHQDRGLVET